MTSKTILAFAAAVAFASCGHNDTLVKTTTQSPQTDYAATLIANNIKAMPKGYSISIGIAGDTVGKPAEGFSLQRKERKSASSATMPREPSTVPTASWNISG